MKLAVEHIRRQIELLTNNRNVAVGRITTFSKEVENLKQEVFNTNNLIHQLKRTLQEISDEHIYLPSSQDQA